MLPDEPQLRARMDASEVLLLYPRTRERLDVAPSWRIAENRWEACVHGIHGVQYDLATGDARPTERVLAERIDEVEPWASHGLDAARALLARPGADRLRAVGPSRAAALLADAFVL